MVIYKIVSKYGGEFTSAFTPPSDPYCLKYEIGKEITAPIGKLFVFVDIKAARDLLWHTSIYGTILECETNETPERQHTCSSVISRSFIDEFWNEEGAASRTPFGSYGVKTLTPLRVTE